MKIFTQHQGINIFPFNFIKAHKRKCYLKTYLVVIILFEGLFILVLFTLFNFFFIPDFIAFLWYFGHIFGHDFHKFSSHLGMFSWFF